MNETQRLFSVYSSYMESVLKPYWVNFSCIYAHLSILSVSPLAQALIACWSYNSLITGLYLLLAGVTGEQLTELWAW